VEAVRMSAPKTERISRHELARLVGVDRSTPTHWASGRWSPRDLERVAKALGVSVAEIYAGRRDRKRKAA
jgi:transcriptional regulator with XRE-family HTH domain